MRGASGVVMMRAAASSMVMRGDDDTNQIGGHALTRFCCAGHIGQRRGMGGSVHRFAHCLPRSRGACGWLCHRVNLCTNTIW